ncbi:hypothetical protein [Cupriavidus pauculus]|uniref:hypothetical protein n=1 Tax=Cupriavidus pauculus TaxID=82633 RepID=UPI000780E8F6|nr:hypothetical protein [Cupriavidus pauculus]
MLGFDSKFEVVGTLDPLYLYASEWKADVPGMGATPALICPVAASNAHCVPTPDVASFVCLEGILFHDCASLCIKVQLGGTQIVWLADMDDPEVWYAIERWKREKAVPIVIGVESGEGWDLETFIIPMRDGMRGLEALTKVRAQLSPAPWEDMANEVTREIVRLYAKTRIEGVQLRHVLAYPLLTKKMSAMYLDEMGKKVKRVCPGLR